MPAPGAGSRTDGRPYAGDGRYHGDPPDQTRAARHKRPHGDHARKPDYLLEALDAGAAGYVLKDTPADRLINAVRRTLDGESPLNQELATRLLRQLAEEKQHDQDYGPSQRREPLEDALTPREKEVLGLLTTGQTNQEIAHTLTISKGTAKVHVERIIRKLGVSDRTQAAVRAIELGFTSPIQGNCLLPEAGCNEVKPHCKHLSTSAGQHFSFRVRMPLRTSRRPKGGGGLTC